MRLRDPKLQTNPITKRKLRGNGKSYIREATQICQLGCVSLGCVHEFKFTQPYWRSPLAESRHWSRCLKRGKVLIRPESAVRQFSEIFVWILSRECQFWKSVRKVTESCPRPARSNLMEEFLAVRTRKVTCPSFQSVFSGYIRTKATCAPSGNNTTLNQRPSCRRHIRQRCVSSEEKRNIRKLH